MAHIQLAPHSSIDSEGLRNYLQQIQRFPILSQEEEYTHAKNWAELKDPKALQALVNSHLRLVAKIAAGYRGYGLPMSDLIAEGNIGMMIAIKKFDLERGYRLSTYARWWIQAAIQEYILKSWSLVKIGTTAAQKKLFFNLRGLKNKLEISDGKGVSDHAAKEIGKLLDVSPKDVLDMDQRLRWGDSSLNAPISKSEGEAGEWIDWLEDDRENQEHHVINKEEQRKRHLFLKNSMDTLNPRERLVIKDRRLTEPPLTLEQVSHKLRVSKERVRQIENIAFHKLHRAIHKEAQLKMAMGG